LSSAEFGRAAVVLLAVADPRERFRAERALAVLAPGVRTSGYCKGPQIVITDDSGEIETLRALHPGATQLVLLSSPAGALAALNAGADAVMARGAPAELRARVRALLRRRVGCCPAGVAVGPLLLDLRRRELVICGETRALGPREFALLACLASGAGRVFTKRELVLACWPERLPAVGSRALETLIVRLRRRLDPHSALLVTVWGVGYVLIEPR
jgi:DNA-binding response OmpR family regulator